MGTTRDWLVGLGLALAQAAGAIGASVASAEAVSVWVATGGARTTTDVEETVTHGRQESREPLTNADVVKMVRAHLSSGIIITTIESAACVFDLSPAGLISLKEAGVDDAIIRAMQERVRAIASGLSTDAATRSAPEKSDLLANAKAPDVILRSFKTMLVDASAAGFFGTVQMKAALGKSKGFAGLNIVLVDDPVVADVVLIVGYTFAWDYPFVLRHQNTSVELLSGKGSGPFSGPKGASSVASELVKLLKPYRVPAPKPER